MSAFWARAARGQLEDALASAGWPVSRRLSLLIDSWIILEEESRYAHLEEAA